MKTDFKSIHKSYRKNLAFRHLGWFICFLLLTGHLTLLTYLISGENSLVPRFTTLLFIIINIVSAFLFVLNWWKNTNLRKILNEIESSEPELYNYLSSSYHLSENPDEIEHFGYSKELVDEVHKRAVSWINNLKENNLRHEPFKMMVFILTILFGLGAILSFHPNVRNRIRLETKRLFTEYNFSIEDIKITTSNPPSVPEGESALIKIIAKGSLDIPKIHWRFSNQQWRTQTLEKDEFETPPIKQNFQYRVSAGNEITNTKTIMPLKSPEIIETIIKMEPPQYTGLGMLRESPFIYGSTSEILWKANRKIVDATFLSEDQPQWNFTVTPNGDMKLSFKALKEFKYHIDFTDELGLNNKTELMDIVIKQDSSPQAKIISPSPDYELPVNMRIPIHFETKDDYWFTKVNLVYEISYTGENHNIQIWGNGNNASASIRNSTFTIMKKDSRLKGSFEWDMADLDLLPGEMVSYWIEVWDNDGVDGPKSGRSTIQVVRSKSIFDEYQNDIEYDSEQVDKLDDLLEKQKEIGKQTEQILEEMENKKLERPASKSEETPFTKKERMEEIAEEQKGLKEEMENLYKEIEKQTDELVKEHSYSLSIRQKMERIQELLNELLSNDMKQVMQKFNDVLEEMSKSQPEKKMEDLSDSLEKYEKKLDRTLKNLEAAYMQKQLEALYQQASEVAKEQKRLKEETESANLEKNEDVPSATSERLAMKQEQLQKQTESILEKMESLSGEMKENFPEVSENLEKAGQNAEEQKITESMEKASEAIKQNKGSEASQSQEQAQKGMEQLMSELESAQNMMGGMSLQMDIAGIREAYERSIQLSLAIGRLIPIVEELQGSAASTDLWKAHPVGKEARWLENEGKIIASKVEEMAAKNPFINYRIIELLNGASLTQVDIVETLTLGQIYKLSGEEKATLAQTNEAAYLLLANMSMLMQQQQSMGLESYFQQLEQLIQQQQKLNEETERLHEEGKEKPGWQQRMEQMANEQRQIREQLQKLQEQQKQLNELLGRFDELGQEMMDVEKMLEDQEAGPEVQEKQKEILTRLLDAEKSQKEQAYSKKRESKPGEKISSPKTAPSEEEREELTRDHLIESQWDLSGESLPYDYREKIEDYFRKMSKEAF